VIAKEIFPNLWRKRPVQGTYSLKWASVSCGIWRLVFHMGCAIALCGTSWATGPEIPQVYELSIPRAPVRVALRELARQTGQAVLFRSALGEVSESNALQGQYTLAAALTVLFAETGLTGEITARGVITVIPATTNNKEAGIMAKLGIKKAVTSLLTALGAGLTYLPATAQENAENSQEQVEEVVVTGQRLLIIERQNRTGSGLIDVPLQEKPRSVQLVDQEALREQVSLNVEDILSLIPGIQTTTVGRSDGFTASLRGQGSAFAIDGVNFPIEFASPIELYESIEVQRGVSGLESGFDASGGGVINFLRKYPQRERFVETFARGDQWGQFRLGVDFNQPLTDAGDGLRLVAVKGYNDTPFRNERSGNYDVGGLSGTWYITPNFIADAAVEYFYEEVFPAGALSALDDNPTAEIPRIDRRLSLSAPWNNKSNKFRSSNIRLNYLFSDNWALQTNLRYIDFGFQVQAYRPDISDFPSGETSTFEEFYDESDRVTDLDIRLKGEFNWNEELNSLFTFGVSRSEVKIKSDFAGGEGIPNNVFNWVPPVGPTVSNGPIQETFRQERLRRDAFVQARTTWRNRYDFWLGVRRASTDIDQLVNFTEEGELFEEPFVSDDSFTTPSFAVAWRPSSAHTVYLNYSESIVGKEVVPARDESGRPYVNAREVLDAVPIEQREIGYKWSSSSVQASVAVYETEEPNLLEVATPQGLRLDRQGLQLYRGVELAAATRFKDKLEISAALVAQEAIVDRAQDSSLNGTDAIGVSRRFADVSVTYSDLLLPRLNARLQFEYQARTTLQTLAFETPSYVTTDFFLNYRFSDDEKATTVQFGVNNLFDKYYWVNTGFSVTPSLVRTVRMEFSKFF
jgi:iron complex outermembrane recepter protein